MEDFLTQLIAVLDYSPLPKATGGDDQLRGFLNIVSAIAGAVALLFLVIGGFRYIISRGDPQSTAKAKDTIIYSVIGLIIVVVAYSIILFVLRNI